MMKKINKTIPLLRTGARRQIFPVFSLPVSALAVVFFAGAAAPSIFASRDQSRNGPVSQVEVRVISDDAYKAFAAAKQEPDPQKRAQKLFDFIQKYPKSPLVEQIPLADYKNIQIIEDEYADFFAASQAPDPAVRADMLLEFLNKHPLSPFEQNINSAYRELLKNASESKNYELLESLAEKWLKIHPQDPDAYASVAEATLNLKKYEKCGESLEALYGIKPSPDLAMQVYSCYQKADNPAKRTEWAARLFQMPEFDKDYMLRYGLVQQFAKENNLPKAAEYAQLTLNSLNLIQAQNATQQEQLRQVRRACYHVIGSNLLAKGEFSQAITSFEEALQTERYGDGYYSIGICLENQKDIEKAILYYALAELMGGEIAPKAKSRLETLYKALHNDTLVGINKVYQKGKDLLAEPEGDAG
jgi:tetratricopeptide (TPR) repeat protein